MEGGKTPVFQVLVQLGLVLELVLELGERLFFGDLGHFGDLGPGFDFVLRGRLAPRSWRSA